MYKLIDEPQYKFLSCALFAVINTILITALIMCVFCSLTVHAEESESCIIITQTGSKIITRNDNGNVDFEYHYDNQYKYYISRYDYVFIVDDTWTTYGVTVPISHLYYYSNGSLTKYSGSITFDFSEVTTGTSNNNGTGTSSRSGLSFTNSYTCTHDYTPDTTETITMNYVTNGLIFGTKESALSYFETGDTSGQLNKPEEINPTSGSILITANVESSYTITLPATLALSYNESSGKYEGEYTVGVQANLINGEAVKVVPNGTVSMTNERGDSVDGIVSQTINTWKLTKSAENEIVSDYTQYINATGYVSANLSKAGSYSGNLNFTFSKVIN